MFHVKLQIKPLSEKIGRDIPLPYYATAGAAAVDLHACIDAPEVIPGNGGQALIPTGLAVAVPEGHVGILASRSSMGLYWLTMRPMVSSMVSSGVNFGLSLPSPEGVFEALRL